MTIILYRNCISRDGINGQCGGVTFCCCSVTRHHTTVLPAVHVRCGSRNGIGGVGFACNIRSAASVIDALLPLIGQWLGASCVHGKGSSFALGHRFICGRGDDGGRILHTVAQTICNAFVQLSAVHDHIMISSVRLSPSPIFKFSCKVTSPYTVPSLPFQTIPPLLSLLSVPI